MHNRFYISYEAARLLKEKGYNEATDYSIDEDNCMMDSRYVLNKDLAEYVCSCPTKSEAIDWLDSKGKIIEVLQDYRGRWFYVIKEVCVGEDDSYFTTRLEAEEAAIIEACKLL